MRPFGRLFPIGEPAATTGEEKTLFLNQTEGVVTDAFPLDGVLPALTGRAVGFIDSRAKATRPFFLYLALNSPHLPVVPGPAWQGPCWWGPVSPNRWRWP